MTIFPGIEEQKPMRFGPEGLYLSSQHDQRWLSNQKRYPS